MIKDIIQQSIEELEEEFPDICFTFTTLNGIVPDKIKLKQFLLLSQQRLVERIKGEIEAEKVKLSNLPNDGTYDPLKFTVAYNNAIDDIIALLKQK